MSDQPTFNEVLGVNLNLDALATDIQAMEDMWDAALVRMDDAAKSMNIMPIAGGGVGGDFAQLSAQIDTLVGTMGGAFNTLAGTITETMSRAEAAIQKVMDKGDAVTKAAVPNPEKMAALYEQALLEDEKWTRRRVAMIEQATKQMEAAQAKIFSPEEINASHEEALLADESWMRKRVALIEQATAQMNAAMDAQKSEQSGGIGAAFMGGFIGDGVEGLASMAGSLAQWMLIWGALQKVIQGCLDIILAIPRGLEEGVRYLGQMQEKAVELQPVLAQAFNFSSDFNENFQIAGEKAGEVVTQLREKAAELGLDFEKVYTSFKSLAASNAGGLTSSVQETLDVSILLERAMRGMTSDQQESRRLQQEIPTLIDGSVSANSRLLEAMHLTVDQWLAILANAKEHKDLLAELTPLLQNYVKAGETLPGTWENLKAAGQQFLNELEAAGAQPVFDILNNGAKELKQYFIDHREQIQAIAAMIGDAVAGLMRMAGAVFQLLADTDLLKAFFEGLLIIVVALAEGLGQAAAVITFMLDETHALGEAISAVADHDTAKLKESWKDAKDAFTEYKSTVEKLDKDAGRALGLDIPEEQNNDLSAPVSGNMPKNAAGPKIISEQQKELAEVLKEQKTHWDTLRESIKTAMADGTESVENGNRRIAESFREQSEQARKATTDYGNKIMASPNIDLKDKAEAWGKAEEGYDKEDLADQKGIDEANRAARKAAMEEKIAAFKKGSEEISNELRSRLAAEKEYEDQNNISAAQASERRKAIREDEYNKYVVLVMQTYEKIQEITNGHDKKFDPELLLNKQRSEVDTQNADSDKVAAQQTAQIEEKSYQDRLHSLQEFYKTQLELAKRAHQEGLTDNTGYVKAEIAAEQKHYEDEREADLEAASNFDLTAKQREAAVEHLALVEQQHADKSAELSKELTGAIVKDGNEQAQSAIRVAQIQDTAAVQEQLARDKAEGNTSKVKQDEAELTEVRLKSVQAEADEAARELELAYARGVTGDALDKLIEKYLKLAAAADAASQAQQRQGSQSLAQQAGDSAFGSSNMDTFRDPNSSATDDFTAGLKSATQALKDFNSVVSAVQSGMKSGGVLGGIGGGLSAAAQFDPEPISSAIMSLAGGLMSTIGSFFEKEAQDIANEVQKAFKQITDNYSTGAATLATTIQQLQAEEQQAIAQLSGVKGGQDQLDKILPGMEQEIASLQEQQEKIVTNFQQQTIIMGQMTQAGQTWLKDWTDINNQVKEFLDAGGSKDEAAKYLNEQLQQMTVQITDQYDKSEQQAIQDTLNLNNMLQQRQSLLQQIQALETASSDSIQRREAGSITTARNNREQLTNLEQQLATLNEQIDVQQATVKAEQQVFGITNDIASLHRLDEELSLRALGEQVAQWKEIKQLMEDALNTLPASATTGQFGGTSLMPSQTAPGTGTGVGAPSGAIPGFGATSGSVPASVTLNITGPITIGSGSSQQAGADLARGLLDVFNSQFRATGSNQ